MVPSIGDQSITSHKILVVDDEPLIVQLLQEWLQDEGYQVYAASSGREAVGVFFEHRPTLSIVDLVMPGMDGFQLITRMREMSDAHILVLSALDSDDQVIRGLNLGADEYLVKPVSRRSFLARVRALLRRASPPADTSSAYSDEVLTLDFQTHEVRVRGEARNLTPTEFRLLGYLCQNRHRVVGHSEALNRVWGQQAGSLDSLKWYIHSLREKIEDYPRSPRLILTVPGVGYRYSPQGQDQQPLSP